MTENYTPHVGDRVAFNHDARRANFFDGKADGRRRMVVVEVRGHDDCVLDDGSIWNACWLEPVDA